MSNSNDTKGAPVVTNKDLHPDFEELLKAEQARATTEKNRGMDKKDSLTDSLDLDNLDDLDHLTDFDHDHEDDHEMDDEGDFEKSHDDVDQDGHHDFNHEDKKNAPEDRFEMTSKKNIEDGGDFLDIEGGAVGGEDPEGGSRLDDSIEFNFDDTSVGTSSTDGETGQTQVKKDPIKKSSNLMYYIIGIAVVVVIGGVFYAMHHRGAPVQNAQQGTGFKPVLPAVHEIPHTLPPPVPQSLQPPPTSIMGGSDDQILGGNSGPSDQSSPGGVTMLQVNRQELLELLGNFQKAVDKSSQSMTAEVSSLRTSLGDINASDVKLSQTMDSRLEQMNSQIDSINQKFDAYNHAITGVQSALEQTQQQLKLILAQRAEDIDHYTLRAIVPGRAWLVDGQGQTVTIVAGQELKNYGTVQEINDKMGYVNMSSGFVFK
jgi:hypothetical protein